MFAAARIGDPVTHDMLIPSGVILPPIAGMLPTGPVIIEALPAAFVTCQVACTGAISVPPGLIHPPPVPPVPLPIIVKGSMTVLINGMPAARWVPSGDLAICGTFLGDLKLLPMRKTLIGG